MHVNGAASLCSRRQLGHECLLVRSTWKKSISSLSLSPTPPLALMLRYKEIGKNLVNRELSK